MPQALYFLGILVGISGTTMYLTNTCTNLNARLFYALSITALMMIPMTFIHLLLKAWGKL